MKKSIFNITLSICFIVLFTFKTYSQNYKNAIGLRAGSYSGITYKQFISPKAAFEIYGLLRFHKYYNQTNFTGVYQIHNNIPNANALKWYYGVGATVGLYGYQDGYFGKKTTGLSLGILGNLGLELTLREIPFCLALDWSPTYFLNNESGFYGDYAHFAVRYILGR